MALIVFLAATSEFLNAYLVGFDEQYFYGFLHVTQNISPCNGQPL